MRLQAKTYFVDNFSRRRHDSENDERTTVHNRVPIKKHLVLAVVSPDHFYFDAELTAEARRHTDGMKA